MDSWIEILAGKAGVVIGTSPDSTLPKGARVVSPKDDDKIGKNDFVVLDSSMLLLTTFLLKEPAKCFVPHGLLLVRHDEIVDRIRVTHQILEGGNFEILEDSDDMSVFRFVALSEVAKAQENELPLRYQIADKIYALLVPFPRIKEGLKGLLRRPLGSSE